MDLSLGSNLGYTTSRIVLRGTTFRTLVGRYFGPLGLEGQARMTVADIQQQAIVRTERGLSIAGTRTTLYAVLDHLKAGWPPELVRQWLDLTEAQMAAVVAYLEAHRLEVEAEYSRVLQTAEENRRYWEEQERHRRAMLATLPPPPGQDAIRAKLRERKAQLGME